MKYIGMPMGMWGDSLGYIFGLCTVGWFTLHILVSVNVLVFAQAEKSGGRELPQSPFSYGLYTFCMNGGMLVWFVYLFVANWKGDDLLC